MPEITFKYERPDFLNDLAVIISENDCSMSATLYPNIPEFLDLLRNYSLDKARQIAPELFNLPVQQGTNTDYWNSMLRTLVIGKACQKHDIYPLWELVFDYSIRQFDYPEIKYAGMRGNTFGSEPSKTFVNPVLFATSKPMKWFRVQINNAEGTESIERQKSAIEEFVRAGYIVTYLNAELHPTVKRRDYMDLFDSDATLSAHDGEVRIYGKKVPGDFDLAKVPKHDFSRRNRSNLPALPIEGNQLLLELK